MKLTEINIYPVKSLAGISLQSSPLDVMGLRYDRRWMLVTPAGKFITQRTHPQMVLIQPQLADGVLTLTRLGMQDHHVPAASTDSASMQVEIWNDTVNALHISEQTDAWLTQAIGAPCRLVYIADDEIRQCDPEYADEGDHTGFADGFPLLLISQASLDDLNGRLQQQLPMKRFRPNLVVSGCSPYVEDVWRQIRIGNITLRVVKPCSRCVITTVDPETGIKGPGEPLRTLAGYRMRDNKIYFGQNLIHEQQGVLSVNQRVIAE
ncbi:MAG TPA: MOSC domain-containing protein [Gammaproteobacteria bacterium]|nr:MOSC domain-containing protein [Gammaproteobacteria bacterium]